MRPAVVTLSALAATVGTCAVTACSSSSGLRATAPTPAHSTSAVAQVRTVTAAPASSAPAASTAPVSTPVTTPPPATASTPTVHATAVPDELRRVLLAPAQVGRGWTKTGSGEPGGRSFCHPGEPPVDQQVRNVERGDITLGSPDENAAVAEQIYVYGSETEAVRHQQIAERGMRCSTGHADDGEPVQIGRRSVSFPHNRVDKIEAWPVRSGRIEATYVLVRMHAVVVQFAFVALDGKQPDVSAQSVVQKGIKKILNRAG